MTAITLSVDAMGGDRGVNTVVAATVAALDRHPELSVVLVGDEQLVNQALASAGSAGNARLTVHHATQVVAMDESPAAALRGKKDSSMRVAINLVKAGEAHACISAGNTGALMATSKFVLKTLPGIDRPALCTAIPGANGATHMLDLGANLDSSAQNLYQFALMGSELVKAVSGIEEPTIGLLNVGSEDMKGVESVREASRLLTESSLNYQGFVEGDQICKSVVDVVVCDGFVGNVALKSAEGVARFVTDMLKAEFKGSLWGKISAMVAMPVLKAFADRVNPDRYNGASLLGLNGVVVKSHGGANEYAFGQAIDLAVLEGEKNVPAEIARQLALKSSSETA